MTGFLSRLFQWYHNAPVAGRIVGPTQTTPEYAGHGDIHYTKHVNPNFLTSGQSWVCYNVVHPFAGVSIFGIDDNGRANGWAKVTDLEGPLDDARHAKVVVQTDNGTARLRLTDVKKCIPEPEI